MQQVVQRHESLRTTFRVDQKSGEPLQYVVEAADAKLQLLDVSGSPSAEDECREAVGREMQRPFDLGAGGALMRGLLIRVAPDEHVLVLNQHHIASDGLSQQVIWRELDALYRGEQLQAALPLDLTNDPFKCTKLVAYEPCSQGHGPYKCT